MIGGLLPYVVEVLDGGLPLSNALRLEVNKAGNSDTKSTRGTQPTDA
jgi:hypothetical protein